MIGWVSFCNLLVLKQLAFLFFHTQPRFSKVLYTVGFAKVESMRHCVYLQTKKMPQFAAFFKTDSLGA